MDVDLEDALDHAAETQPYPIAAACAEVQAAESRDDWHEWELLSRDLLTPVLTYLSHLLLSDLVATGREPAHLFHRVESILSRPLAGHYVGFLRETARYYREEEVETAVPELIDFLLAAEVDEERLPDEKPLLGTLVNYRNLWAHGRIENEEVIAEDLREIRRLTAQLLAELGFLTDYPLTREDGTVLMGTDAPLSESPEPLVVISAGEVALRPLLLKLEGADLMMLSDLDLGQRRLDYRGQEAFVRFTEEDIEEDGEARRIFQELKDLVDEVRALEAPLPAPDWDSFKQRTDVETDRMLTLYGEENAGKYVPDLFVPRPRWEGEDNPFSEFMESEKSLLAITGDQGKGKSALAGRLVTRCREAGHATWLVNGQRFTFADVTWSGTPYPKYFAERLSYERPFDRGAIERIVESAPEGKKAVLFIDAVNEVDGIEAKWNRFRAMRLLLEWIVEVAQPGLKVVLTFRMEAYEEFDALGPGEWPEGLEEVAHPGDHPRKPWALELEPFGAQQAREFYEHLQELPERGMAPQMSWDQIQEDLGEELETFTANPLLYQIFLNAHNGRTSILTTDQEELFERYADKVIGRVRARKRPWWEQAWGFLKNGDVLPKERFLADLSEKMAEQGSEGFLIDQLKRDSNDRDERLQEVLTDPSLKHIIDDLEEGGLLNEEIVEKPKDKGKSKRYSLIDDMLVTALDLWAKKVKTRRAIYESIITSISIVFILILSAVIVAAPEYVGTEDEYLRSFIISSIKSASIPATIAVFYVLFVYCIYRVYLGSRATPKELGLAAYHYLSNRYNLISKEFLIITLYTLMLVLCLSYATGLEVSMFTAGMTIFLLLSLLYPRLLHEILKRLEEFSSIRVRKISHSRTVKYIKRLNKIRTYIILTLISFSTLAAGSVLYYIPAYWNEMVPKIPKFLGWGKALFYADLESAISQVAYSYIPIMRSSIVGTILLISFIPLLIIVAFGTQYRIAMYTINNPHIYTDKWIKIKVAVLWSLCALVIAYAIDLPLESRENEVPSNVLKEFETLSKRQAKYGVGSINLNNLQAPLTQGNIQKLYSLDDLKSITLPYDDSLTVNISMWEEMESVTARSGQLEGLNKTEVEELTVVGKKASFNNWPSVPTLGRLEIKSDTLNVKNIDDVFPELAVLTLSSSNTDIVGYFPRLKNNNTIIKLDPGKTATLGWLTKGAAHSFLWIIGTIDNTTENVSLLRRVALEGKGLNPEVLQRADSLRGLTLFDPPSGKESWISSLTKVIKQDLPELELLSIHSNGDIRKARSTRNMIKMLEDIQLKN